MKLNRKKMDQILVRHNKFSNEEGSKSYFKTCEKTMILQMVQKNASMTVKPNPVEKRKLVSTLRSLFDSSLNDFAFGPK